MLDNKTEEFFLLIEWLYVEYNCVVYVARESKIRERCVG